MNNKPTCLPEYQTISLRNKCAFIEINEENMPYAPNSQQINLLLNIYTVILYIYVAFKAIFLVKLATSISFQLNSGHFYAWI